MFLTKIKPVHPRWRGFPHRVRIIPRPRSVFQEERCYLLMSMLTLNTSPHSENAQDHGIWHTATAMPSTPLVCLLPKVGMGQASLVQILDSQRVNTRDRSKLGQYKSLGNPTSQLSLCCFSRCQLRQTTGPKI